MKKDCFITNCVVKEVRKCQTQDLLSSRAIKEELMSIISSNHGIRLCRGMSELGDLVILLMYITKDLR